eukprot:1015309_1
MSKEMLVVYGFIRRMDGFVSQIIPRQLYDICVQYCSRDPTTLVYIQNTNAINLFNPQHNDSILRYSAYSGDSIKSLNTHPNESINMGWCGNAYMIHNPTTSFAFVQSDFELPNHITQHIPLYQQDQYFALFQCGGKTWVTDVECNLFIIKKSISSSNDHDVLYRWKLPEMEPRRPPPFGYLYSKQFGLLCLKEKEIYALSLHSMDVLRCKPNQWSNKPFSSFKSRHHINNSKCCMINTQGEEQIFIVDCDTCITEIYNLKSHESHYGASIPRVGTRALPAICYDQYHTVYVMATERSKDDANDACVVYSYDIGKNKWCSMPSIETIEKHSVAMPQANRNGICMWTQYITLYVTGQNWSDIKYINTKSKKTWNSQPCSQCGVSFLKQDMNFHRSSKGHLLCN